MNERGAYQKKAQNIENVHARLNFLINGIKAPLSVEKAVYSKLAGQRTFASLNLPKLKITPLSLNTLKKLADELFVDQDGNGNKGFAYLNTLRLQLILSLSEAAARRTVEVKTGRAASKTDGLTAQLAATEAQSIKRLKAYLSLYQNINGLIKSGSLQTEARERLYRILENHHAAFSNLLEPNNESIIGVKFTVPKLHEARKPK